jgi:hypothetical protein
MRKFTNARRNVIVAGAGLLVLALSLLIALPFLFRDRIAARAQAAISRSIDADVSWGDVGLSLLRDFPNASLRLQDLTVTGRDRFAGDTLTYVPRFDLVIGLPSILRSVRGSGPLVVRSIEIERPAVHLRVLDDGIANWDLFSAWEEASSSAETSRSIALNLRRLELRGGTLTVDNAQTGLQASLAGLQQSLSGDFTQTRFHVRSRSTADAVSVSLAGVPWLRDVALDADAELDVDTDAGRIDLVRTSVRLNELQLEVAGGVGLGEEALALNLAFETPGTSFHEILSLLPILHERPGFAELRTWGTMAVSGWVRGDYGENAFPSFSVVASVRDGQFQYPDLPLPARAVFLDLALRNPGGDPDSTTARVDRFSVVIGDEPITGRFAMRTPFSDPELDFAVHGELDLAALQRTLKLTGADELAGRVIADVSARGRRSDLDAAQYDRIQAEGSIRASSVDLRMDGLPQALAVQEGVLRIAPDHASLETFRGTIGSSDLDLTGRLDNLFGYLFRDEALRGTARLASTRFDLDEWRSDDEMRAIIVPARIDFAFDARVDTLVFADLELRNARGSLRVRDERATLDGFGLEMFGGTLAVTGVYESTTPARPTFDASLDITSIQVAEAARALDLFRALAPAARYAEGRVSTRLGLSGALGEDMTPVYDVLAGTGTFETAGLSLQGFPALAFLAERLSTEQLRNPALLDVRSTFRIEDGRLHVSPFDVGLGEFMATISGSHGLDETMDYTLALSMPRTMLGAEAGRAVAALATQAGRTVLEWEASDVVTVRARLAGTVRQPSVGLDLQETADAALRGAGTALRDEAERRQAAAGARADSAVDEARLRAAEEAARLLEEAELQAARIREEADSAAEAVRRQGYQRADSLVARAGNPATRLAAQAAAARLREEADEAAARIRAEADQRADALVADARRRAGGPGG